MKVKTMIEELSKMNPEADVKLHHPEFGDIALFVLADTKGNVFIEGKNDIDIGAELGARFDELLKEDHSNEEEFFSELKEIGFTLEDIKEYVNDMYEYSKKFFE